MTDKEEAEIDALLKSLWERNLPVLRERLDALDAAAAEAVRNQLTDASRVHALDIAHKLSGSLGMFGYDQGTDIARQMEQILRFPTSATLGNLVTLAEDLRQSLIE